MFLLSYTVNIDTNTKLKLGTGNFTKKIEGLNLKKPTVLEKRSQHPTLGLGPTNPKFGLDYYTTKYLSS